MEVTFSWLHRSWLVSRSESCAARTVLAAGGGCSPVDRHASSSLWAWRWAGTFALPCGAGVTNAPKFTRATPIKLRTRVLSRPPVWRPRVVEVAHLGERRSDPYYANRQTHPHIPGATGFHVRPRISVVERINKHRRCVRDYETRPDHHEAMVHLAMITTMTGDSPEPDGFQTPSYIAYSDARVTTPHHRTAAGGTGPIPRSSGVRSASWTGLRRRRREVRCPIGTA